MLHRQLCQGVTDCADLAAATIDKQYIGWFILPRADSLVAARYGLLQSRIIVATFYPLNICLLYTSDAADE